MIDVALIGHLESTAEYTALLDELRSGRTSDPDEVAALLRHLQPAPVCDVPDQACDETRKDVHGDREEVRRRRLEACTP